jgi:YidC/Oxa1 family membrane protein insertase
VIVQIHTGLSFIVDKNSGWAWGGSIILLTVLMRLLVFPLFVKQIHASRKIQELNPQIQALRKKYKNDKQRLNQEVMALYQKEGANPLSGCLPVLVQMPVFIGLFQVLNKIATAKPGNGSHGISAELVESAQRADIFGATIATKFLDAWSHQNVSGIVITGIAVLISSTTTFFTIRSSMKRQPAMDPDNPMASAQKMMVVLAPVFGLFGLGFPLGVLIYWVTSNSWTLAQQHYIYKRYPTPVPGQNGGSGGGAPASGTKAATKPEGRTPKGGTPKGTKRPSRPEPGNRGKLKREEPSASEPESSPKVIRQQPVRKSRSKRSGSSKR